MKPTIEAVESLAALRGWKFSGGTPDLCNICDKYNEMRYGYTRVDPGASTYLTVYSNGIAYLNCYFHAKECEQKEAATIVKLCE